MNRRTGPILPWIIGIAYTCAMALSLLLMIGSAVAMQQGLTSAIGLLIAAIGCIGCLALLFLGGVAIVCAATVFFMKKFGNHAPAAGPDDGKSGQAAADATEKGI